MQPVQLTMQPLQPQGASPPVPQRWAEALRNVQAAQRQLDDLARQLDSALYIDEEAWRQAVPQAQFTAALQGQQRKIMELEAHLATVVARLEESERARRAAEARVSELSTEVENHGSVFKLHYEELLRKDREIGDLQAVIQALSLGGTAGDAGSSDSSRGGTRGGAAAGHRGGRGPAAGPGEGVSPAAAAAAAAAAGSLEELLRGRGGGSSAGSGGATPLASLGSDVDDY